MTGTKPPAPGRRILLEPNIGRPDIVATVAQVVRACAGHDIAVRMLGTPALATGSLWRPSPTRPTRPTVASSSWYWEGTAPSSGRASTPTPQTSRCSA